VRSEKIWFQFFPGKKLIRTECRRELRGIHVEELYDLLLLLEKGKTVESRILEQPSDEGFSFVAFTIHSNLHQMIL
jgi:hypothetical protein